jgi:hypothetical protein
MSKKINRYRKPLQAAKPNKSKISFVNLSSYTSPEIIESINKDYVEYGADNNYFQFLIDRYNGSATNNAVINGISQMIYGKGLDATDSERKPEAYARMISLFKKDDVRNMAHDLKWSGQCAMQLFYDKATDTYNKAEHVPIETLRAIKVDKEDDKIQAYDYFPKWADIKPSDKPLRIPAFGCSDIPKPVEILYIKPYRAGMYYYSTPDYQGALQYCELEEEISNYHLNNIMNGLAPSMLINFNNGTPSEPEQKIIENKINTKFGGSSNTGKFILAFNDNKESQADITPVQLSDAPEQYQFLSTESQSKIMVGHRVVSPLLFGIKDNSGFGSNADELKTASILMHNTVIIPFQELLLDAFDKVLAYNGISLNLYFKTLQPLQFLDLENTVDEETREEETGVKLSKDDEEFNDEEMLNSLDGEEVDDEWELVESREYSEDNDDIDKWANRLITEDKTMMQKLADLIKSKPNGFSYLDKSFYKVRYKYAEKYSSSNSRKFCKTMMARTNKGVVYRLEDIDKASREGVNKSFGHEGQAYDLFKFKGGKQCGHFFEEQLYRLKKKTNKGSELISQYDETNNIPKTYEPSPRGNKDSKIAPKDMKDGGAYPNK